MNKWLVIITCPDCTGQDDFGCFDGGTDKEEFETYEDAERWAIESVDDSIYTYEIIDISK